MTRESRMLLFVGVMALVGVSALAMLANRYARLQPSKSVLEIAPEAGATAPAQPGPAPTPAPARTQAPTPAPTAGTGAERTAQQIAVETFIDARTYIVRYLDEHPRTKRQFEREVAGEMETGARNRMHIGKLLDIKVGRGEILLGAGMDEAAYFELRDAFRVWHEGGEVRDAALAAAFDERRAELEALHLGALEPLDDI